MFILLLPEISWPEVWKGVIHEFQVALFIAIFVLVIHFLTKRLLELFAWFMPVRVYGKWHTFLQRREIDNARVQSVTPRYGNVWERTRFGRTYRVTEEVIDDLHSPRPTSSPPGLQNDEQHEEAELHQFLHLVWGEAKRKSDPAVRYIVAGHVRGEKLSLVYREKNGMDTGAILLAVKSKTLMEGFEIGCDRDRGNIYSNPYYWRKV